MQEQLFVSCGGSWSRDAHKRKGVGYVKFIKTEICIW